MKNINKIVSQYSVRCRTHQSEQTFGKHWDVWLLTNFNILKFNLKQWTSVRGSEE